MLANIQSLLLGILRNLRADEGGLPWEKGAEMEISMHDIYWGVHLGSTSVEARESQQD